MARRRWRWEGKKASDLPFHPVANLFPLLEGREFADLAADIRRNGLMEPVVTRHGSIIDGRNRYRACQRACVPVATLEWNGQGSLVAYVVSLNLHRRHLDTGQRAMIAAELENLSRGRPGKNVQLRMFDPVPRRQAANLLSVSPRTVADAARVRAYGVPALAEAVKAGAVSVSEASLLTDLPQDEQREVFKAGPEAVARRASAIRHEKWTDLGAPVPVLRSSLAQAVEAARKRFGAFDEATIYRLKSVMDAAELGATSENIRELIALATICLEVLEGIRSP